MAFPTRARLCLAMRGAVAGSSIQLWRVRALARMARGVPRGLAEALAAVVMRS